MPSQKKEITSYNLTTEMNIIKKIVFLILITITLSCESDDESTIQKKPSSFKISVEIITEESAHIKWEESTSQSDSQIRYSIYLDGELLISGQEATEYDLLDLTASTSYEVKVLAINDFGEASSSFKFTTLEMQKLYLKKLTKENGNGINLYYENEKIANIQSIPFNGIDQAEFIYDVNGNIIEENFYREWNCCNRFIDYSYSDNNLSQITVKDVYDASSISIYEIEYDSETSYTRSYFEQTIGDPFLLKTFKVEIIKDSKDRIIEYESVNVETNTVNETYSFEYDVNNNLVRIIDMDENVYDIIYDNKNNFHTYTSTYVLDWHNTASDFASLIYFPIALSYVYELYYHINKNNPFEYRKNGETLREFEYDYNEKDYPTKITTGDVVFSLEYY